ncbi:hypothetical protein CTAYLR_001541 [Chrysophaeum taylorii]|uniref:alpha-1,3-mannosyl-glycoprotein 2-beta-N-acetylglucosaminyltransferase n=1 Tax=Chrysophaeum taylorii TaxID=2483200 RepID=A0AAD7UE97_9STRA|nr:hypothetical protein CTAYLR_001541 [Chrysophaeum taylorii]
MARRRDERLGLYQMALVLCIVFALGVHLGLHLVAAPHETNRSPREKAKKMRQVFEPPPPAGEAMAARQPEPTKARTSEARDPVQPPPEMTTTTTTTRRGPFAAYLATGRRLPIVLLACDRPEALRNTLVSLLRGAAASDVAVVQDGADEAVAAVAREFGLVVERNNGRPRDRDGAARIARNYKYALGWALEQHFVDAPGVIVVEDDLLFSPDFLNFMETVGPIVDEDESVLVVSAWNDNGFFEDQNPRKLLRTHYFPGLGWLLPRRLWVEELKPKWPKTHWDHWLRDPAQHRGRECVFPAVPRSFHAGAKGTFMDSWHHARYFSPIKYNLDASIRWREVDAKLATRDVYEADLRARFQRAHHVATFADLDAKATATAKDTPIVFWYSWKPHDGNDHHPPNFVCVSEVFRLWHERKRAEHHGTHEAVYKAHSVILVNAQDSKYARHFKPPALVPLQPPDCPPRTWRDLGRD